MLKVKVSRGIKEDSELSSFILFKKTGLDEVLKKPSMEWTIFAPTNKAFDASPERVKKKYYQMIL